MTWLLVIVGSLLLAEFYGYWLHVLLHSYLIPPLSIAHMDHHISSYPPGSPQRSSEYIRENNGEITLFGIGLEWLAPSLVILLLTILFEWLIGLSWHMIILSVSTIIIYTILLFSVLHDTFHIKNHPILRIKWIKKWYLKIRKLHDIHHHFVDEKGLMNKNYGIAFFFFDKIFNTYLPTLRGGYSKKGISIAKNKLKKYTNFHD